MTALDLRIERMEATIKDQHEILSGFLFIVIGLAFLVIGRGLPLGTATYMGPGYIPFGAAVILMLLGGVCIVRGLRNSGTRVDPIIWRPIILVPIAVLAFALSLGPLGLVVAIFLTVGIGRLAIPGAKLRHTATLAAGMAALCVVLFVYGFGTPVSVWPRFL